MYFGKGLDLLLEAFTQLPSNYWLLVASSSSGVNYNFDPLSLNAERVLHLNEFIPEEQVPILFSASNLVCLPYRKTYEGGTSGVLVQAALANRPICAPDMKPFSEVIEKFNVGVTFEAENIQSMLEALTLIDSQSASSAGWNRYLSLMPTWNEIAMEYLGF
jgi:glycosyltransferase involved in cell wall biosynthesis